MVARRFGGNSFDRLAKLYRLLRSKEKLAAWERRLRQWPERAPVSRTEFDMLKSSIDVPPGTVDEFHAWKASNPIPERPLVTVTVSTYNRARLLTERCIPSILQQTYDKLELVVVGDHCTDDTAEAVARIDDPRLRFFNLPERPVYPTDPERRWMVAGTCATNQAYSMANGDFVTHLDDDDAYLPDRIEKLVAFAVEQQCDLVWHPFWWEQADGNWLLWESPAFEFAQVTNASVFYRSWFLRFESKLDSHLLLEPGDWNRFRKIKYLHPVMKRYPEPLLRHYREGTRKTETASGP